MFLAALAADATITTTAAALVLCLVASLMRWERESRHIKIVEHYYYIREIILDSPYTVLSLLFLCVIMIMSEYMKMWYLIANAKAMSLLLLFFLFTSYYTKIHTLFWASEIVWQIWQPAMHFTAATAALYNWK